jgi:hypothetical protein
MRKIAANLEENSEELIKRVALAVDSNVVIATPVDTGRARSNWQAAIGRPKRSVIERRSVAATIAEAKGVVEGYKEGDTIYLSNNLPYIRRLNDGWSAQAPKSFVQIAILNGLKAIANSKSLLGD